MRILALNYEYPPLGGGSSPVTAALCQELGRLGVTVDLVTMGFRDLPRLERHGAVTVYRVPGIRSARHISFLHELLTYILAANLKARQLAKTREYDLVHSHFIVPCGLVAHRLHRTLGLSYVITAHGSDVPGYNPDRFRHVHRWIAPAWRRVVSRAELITSPSEILASLIRKATPDSIPIRIVPNAIDPDWNRPLPKKPQILVISRLFERKGVQFVLKALQDDATGQVVHVVGDGPQRSTLERLATKVADEVVFHGWLKNDSSDLKQLFGESMIMVFPSEAENFPMVLLEAMVSGIAIIASDIPGSREVLGDAAVYVPPRDPDAIRHALDRLIGNREHAESLGRQARQRAVENFSWEVVGNRYHECFQSILDQRNQAV